MNTKPIPHTTAVAVLIAGIAIHQPAVGQISPSAPPDGNRPHLARQIGPLEELSRIVESLSKRHGSTVLLDPAIRPAFRPRAPSAGLPLEKALDSLAAALPRTAWRRVFLPRSQELEERRPAELTAAVRMLSRWEAGSLMIEDDAARRTTMLLTDHPKPQALPARLKTLQLNDRPVYVLYNIDDAPDHNYEEQFTHLQRQQLKMKVAPEYQALGMIQMMQIIQSMDQVQRDELMERTGRAAMLMWDQTPPGQRREMIEESLRLMKSFDGGLRARAGAAAAPSPHRGDRHNRPEPSLNYLPQLQSIVHDLSKRSDIPIVVDRGLLVTDPPEAPDHSLSIDKAIEALIASIPDAVWRRVRMPERPAKRALTPERLTAAVQTLDQWEDGGMIIDDPESRRMITLFQNRRIPAPGQGVLEVGSFSRVSVYVLYSASAGAVGRTQVERFSDLQRQQTLLMTQMTTDQISASMLRVARRFSSSDADTRSRLMGLPIMAGMMAVWFPREAKENGPLTPDLASP
jgi:hypothetical protein